MTTSRHGELMTAARTQQSADPPGTALPRRRRAYPGEERKLCLLRRWIGSLLLDHPARDDVLLVATELASNAIKHTGSGRGGWFAVEVTWDPRLVRVAVADCGALHEPQVTGAPLAGDGRGLLMVRRLADRMGVRGDQSGRLVWADIACGERADTAASAPAGLEPVHWPQFPLPATGNHDQRRSVPGGDRYSGEAREAAQAERGTRLARMRIPARR